LGLCALSVSRQRDRDIPVATGTTIHFSIDVRDMRCRACKVR
jgi:hypothetical protein